MPSFVPVMRMLALGSSGRGMAILVAVFSSSSCSFSPFLPITKRWCSLGMATVAEAWREKRGECLKLITMETQRGKMAVQSVKQPYIFNIFNIFTGHFLQLLLVSVVVKSS